ncbi:MAG TPA: hypothetical protein PKC59_09175 [Burkholderiaceae bacterium]|nr:hypothetical protein [Burkholderiaceae bacterium]
MPQPPKPPLPKPRPHRGARPIASLGLLAALALTGSVTAAFDFDGRKTLVAVTADGARTPLGHIDFTPAAGAPTTFRLALKTEVFTDHFLSMREFKCLNAAQEISCHVPYPYPNPATVGPGQLAWLEHSLLFLVKRPAEFGAKLWNGVYYEFQEQGAALVGRPKAVDLNEISAPPRDPSTPPFRKALRHDMPAQARWLRELVIE